MWFVFALLSSVFAALTSILAKVGIEGVNSTLATAVNGDDLNSALHFGSNKTHGSFAPFRIICRCLFRRFAKKVSISKNAGAGPQKSPAPADSLFISAYAAARSHLNHSCAAHAAADAQGSQTLVSAAMLHGVQQSDQDTSAGCRRRCHVACP